MNHVCRMLALMKDDQLVMVVAEMPDDKNVVDITDQLARKLHYVRSSPPVKFPLPKMADPCPQPDQPGWTRQDCFDAQRCGCAEGVALGYTPTTLPIEQNPRISEWTKDEHGNLSRTVGG